MDHLEEIRAKISIEELVGSYIQLKKAGRNLKGLCPFHSDKNPSLMVSPEKGIAYCFACNNGGDIFKFIQLIENVDFPEAVKILAQKANVTIPAFSGKNQNKRLRIIEANSSAIKFFSEQLENSKKQYEYFINRGLSKETIQQFKLGYAPDSYNALKNHLLKIGYKEKELSDAGLLNQRSIADKNTYDRFRNRLIFPILDHQDNAIGFGGRIIGDGEPKYLNSPETPAYNKSLVLYGLNWAKKSVKKENIAIFVEGYMDVIAAHQAGTKNVIATSGTALTPSQLKLIKRYTTNIAFAFDQDSAGIEATRRAIELAQEAELNIKIITMPEGKDPDDCIKESLEEWLGAIKNAVPVMDFYFNYAEKQFDKNTIDGKKGYMNLLLPLIKQHKTEMEQSEYLDKLSLEIKTDVKFLWNDLKNLSVKTAYRPKNTEKPDTPKTRIFTREEFLLGFIFQNPALYEIVKTNLIDSITTKNDAEKFYKACKKVYNRESTINIDILKEELASEDKEQVDIYRLLIDKHYPNFSESASEREVQNLIQSINRKNLLSVQKDFEFKIRSAGNSEEKILLLNQYNEILKLKTKIN